MRKIRFLIFIFFVISPFQNLKPEIITELVEKKTPHQKEKFGSIRRFVTFFTIYEFVKDIQKELEKLKNKKNS